MCLQFFTHCPIPSLLYTSIQELPAFRVHACWARAAQNCTPSAIEVLQRAMHSRLVRAALPLSCCGLRFCWYGNRQQAAVGVVVVVMTVAATVVVRMTLTSSIICALISHHALSLSPTGALVSNVALIGVVAKFWTRTQNNSRTLLRNQQMSREQVAVTV